MICMAPTTPLGVLPQGQLFGLEKIGASIQRPSSEIREAQCPGLQSLDNLFGSQRQHVGFFLLAVR